MKTKRVFAFLFAALLTVAMSGYALAAEFEDVPATHEYKAAIDFCQSKGYVQGVSSTKFEPDTELTRGQLAVIWSRYLHLRTTHTFTDLPMSSGNYYDIPSLLMYSLGVLNGTSGTEFSPNNNLTREQIASITTRTFLLGAANENDYQIYSDHATVSDWAREGISACLNNDLFKDLYDEANLEPGKAVTRGEICKLIYNIEQPAYMVEIADLTGGTITALPARAQEGTTIRLTVTPNSGMRLKAGSLKYNDTVIAGANRTFTMPAEDVLVTAEFEEAPTLESIEVTTLPTKTTYVVGEDLALAGLVVTATYSDDTTAPVTNYTTAPAEGTDLAEAATVTVTVSYTEGGVTMTDTFDVTVSAAPAASQ